MASTDRRGWWVTGSRLLLVILVPLAGMGPGASGVGAQQRCYFLECPGGQPSGQAPALPATPAIDPRALPKGPVSRSLARPSRAGETCQRSGGITYCASSVLAPQQGNVYVPANVVDGRLETAWVEGRPGDGIGEWIVVDFDRVRRVRSIQMMNGYHKNEDLFRKNSRIREAELTFSDGSSRRVVLEDRGGIQVLPIDGQVFASWLQVTILSVYRGTRYADTAITELRVETSD